MIITFPGPRYWHQHPWWGWSYPPPLRCQPRSLWYGEQYIHLVRNILVTPWLLWHVEFHSAWLILCLLFKVRWLLRHGARITHDKYGKTPMNDAAENKQLEVNLIIKYFLSELVQKFLNIENLQESWNCNICCPSIDYSPWDVIYAIRDE